MRCHGKVVDRSYGRSSLPGLALVFAGVEAAGGRREPCVSREVEAVNTGAKFQRRGLYLLLNRHPLSVRHLGDRFGNRVGDGVFWFPGAVVKGEDAAVG